MAKEAEPSMPVTDGQAGAGGRLRNSLIWKIALFLLAGVGMIFTLLSAADYYWQRRAFLDMVQSHIAGEARLLVALVRTATTPEDFDHILASLASSPDAPRAFIQEHQVFLVDETGVVQLASTPSMMGRRLWNPHLSDVLHNVLPEGFGVMEIEGTPVYYGVFPATLTDGTRMAVLIAKPYPPLLSEMRVFLIQRILLLTLLTGALLVAALSITHYTVLSPLKRLVQTMEQVSRGNLDIRVHIPQNDQLGTVGRTFNRMVTALQQAQKRRDEEQRRLALLYDINRQLVSVSDWDTLVDLVLHLPEKIVPARAAMFLSYHETTRRFTLEGAWGFSPLALAALEQHLSRTEDPYCLRCPSCLAHTESQCPLLVPHLLRDDKEYILCLRLAHGDTTVGFLYLCLSSETPLPPERLQLLNAVSGELAVAVAAARARAREIHLLASLKTMHRSPRHLSQTLQTILERTLEVAQAHRGAIFLVEGEAQSLRPVAWHGVEKERLAEWHGLALQGLHQHEPMVVVRRFLSGAPSEHLAVVPLRAGEVSLGVLLLASPPTSPYSRHTLTFLSAIAAQIALTIQTARLYTRLEQQAILEERTRLAREIHDGLAQNLAYIRWKLYQLDRWQQQGDPSRLAQEMSLLRQVVEESYQEVREAIEGLRLTPDPQRSFVEILEDYARRFALRTGLHVDLHLQDVRLPLAPQIQLLRVVQEALANVRKHAHASRITLSLTQHPDGIRLVIQDDGVGFDPDRVTQDTRRFGLRIMAERVQVLGGQMRLQARPGEGTRIAIWIPASSLSPQEDAHADHPRVGGG